MAKAPGPRNPRGKGKTKEGDEPPLPPVLPFSDSSQWEKLVVDEETAKRFVAPEIMLLFDIAEDEGVPIVLTGGTARDFAITATQKKSYGFPHKTNYGLAIPLPAGEKLKGDYNDEKYAAFESRLAKRFAPLRADKKRMDLPMLNFVPGVFVEQRYVFEHVIAAETGAVFSINRLAVEKKGGEYVIFGQKEAVDDLKNGVLRILPSDSPIGSDMAAKMIGKSMIYRQAGFELDQESRKRLAEEVGKIPESDYQTFIEKVLVHAQTDNLSPGKSDVEDAIKQIMRIQPLEMAADEWDAALAERKVAFRVGDRNVRLDLRNKTGDFQGVYRLRDGRIVVFRSSFDKRNNSRFIDGFELEDGKEASRCKIFFDRLIDDDGVPNVNCKIYSANVNRSEVHDDFKRHGIASLAFERLENDASSTGMDRCRVISMREDVRLLSINRGYEVIGESSSGTIMEKALTKSKEEDNMSEFHTFLGLRDGKQEEIVIPIKD